MSGQEDLVELAVTYNVCSRKDVSKKLPRKPQTLCEKESRFTCGQEWRSVLSESQVTTQWGESKLCISTVTVCLTLHRLVSSAVLSIHGNSI